MVGAFTAFILMMQTNSGFLNTQLDTTQNEIQKIQGQFTIGAAYDSTIGNRLCVSVKNRGSTPLEMADLFIENQTDHNAKQFDIDYRDAFIPPSSTKQIVANLPITLKPGTHTIKAVSTSGIAQTTELKVFSSSSLDPRLNVTSFVYPVNAASGVNVTLGMHVYNRSNTTLINVQPNSDPSVIPAEAVSNGYPLMTTPRVIPRLDPNEDALFLWDPEFVGGVGSKLNFTFSAKALVEGCTTSSFIKNNSSAILKVIPGVKRQILASPEIFIAFPSPFGQASGTGIFAVVVQNPTNKAFTVSQVALQILNPNSQDVIKTSGVTGVTPTIADWSQATDVATWKGTAIRIPSLDSREFIVRVNPKTSLTTAPINSVIFNVYSSYGQFGKGPFTFGISGTNTGVVSVYAKTSSTATSPKYEISDLVSGTTLQKFYFTIANNGSAVVDSSASARPYLLINIPPGIRDVADNPSDTSSGLTPHDLVEFDDGSSQKAIEITSSLGTAEARTYSMTATLPTITVPAHYIFTLTANGTSASSLLGPQAEIDVQVCPPTGSSIVCQ